MRSSEAQTHTPTDVNTSKNLDQQNKETSTKETKMRLSLFDIRTLQSPERPSFQGFFNLAIIILVAAVLLLVVQNLYEKGILVDLYLIKCISGDFVFGSSLIIWIYASCIVMYFISWNMMANIHWKNNSRRFIFNAILYVLCQISLLFSVIYIIFTVKLSVIVSVGVAMTLLTNCMKMHSYYVYMIKFPFQKKRPLEVSFNEFIYFLTAPTLLFKREYEKTDKIRWNVVLGYILQIFAVVFCMYVICLQFLDPLFKEATTRMDLMVLLKTSIPWFITWLLGSYAIFHCYLNLIAELTCFADRRFFEDWWNAASFDEFWRKWNIPVHNWLLVHVYFESMRLHFSKPTAVWITFLLSGILHELVMAICFRSIQYYFFAAMLCQVPFVWLGHKYRTSEIKGNFFMWGSLFCGQPLMLLLYFRNWYSVEGSLC